MCKLRNKGAGYEIKKPWKRWNTRERERERERAYLYKTCLFAVVEKVNRSIDFFKVNVYMYRVRNCLYDTC